MISDCAALNCRHKAVQGNLFCPACVEAMRVDAGKLRLNILTPVSATMGASSSKPLDGADLNDRRSSDARMSFKYPKYYKAIPTGITELDIYLVCSIFQVQDYSGALHHAIKKILLPGVRTGGKSRYDDIKEARDTLSRWLEINRP
jgi:hypothetical protein